MSNQSGWRNFWLRSWIRAKMLWSKTTRDPRKEAVYVYNTFRHLDRVPTMEDMEALGIRYKSEYMLSAVPWDYQWSADKVLRRGEADCNSLNRVVQIAALIRGKQAFLVTYWPESGIKDAHTTCIIRRPDGLFTPLDYGYPENFVSASPDMVIDRIASQYSSGYALTYVAQDWKWKFQILGS